MKKQARVRPIELPDDLRVRRIAGAQRAPFAAALSPAELWLAREMGYEPIAPVTGTSVIQVPQASALMSRSRESPVLTGVIEGMWCAALVRMQEQARILGATGIVAAHIQAWGVERDKDGLMGLPDDRPALEDGDTIRVSLIGTAVRIAGLPATGVPFVCSLSGQEICALAQAGFRPVGFAYGNCVWSQVSRQRLSNRRNKEVTGMTLAIYRARRLVIERAQKMAAAYAGQGILGLKLRFRVLEFARGPRSAPRADVALSFFAGGTVVASLSSQSVSTINHSNINYSLMLNDRSKRRTKQGEN
ncbi:MAG TPA: hypothetical protein VFW40_00870 [Capsulimonadaceae bacterium]|nr:hypothetical protein [Capsulimonadaceae bacterium]